jgi:hypothetical protein
MDLLTLPEIQSGAIPFLVGLISSVLLGLLRPSWFVIGALVGFYSSAIAMGVFDLSPTRSVNRIFLLGVMFLLATVSIYLLPGLKANPKKRSRGIMVLALLAVAAVFWLIWSAALRQGMPQTLVTFSFAAAYAGWTIHMLSGEKLDSLQRLSATCFLALSTGICVILGASALLGQLAVSMGAAYGALLLITTFRKNVVVDSALLVPSVVVITALGIAGVVFAKVSWTTLLILAAIPLAVRLPVPHSWPGLARAALISAYAFAVGASASLLAWWQNAQSASYY